MPYQQPLSSVHEYYGQSGHPAPSGDQDFSVENPRFAPFDHVLHQVRLHPDAGYAICDVEGPSDDELRVDFGPEPEDLDERFHWHVSKRVQANMARILTHQAKQAHAKRKHRGYHVAVRGLEALDPLYERTMDVMQHYLENLPEVLKPLVMPTLARHSPSFLALYQHLRHAAETVENHRHHQGKKRKAASEAAAKNGNQPHSANAAARAAELQALKERVRRGGAVEGDLYKYIDLSGMIP